MATQEELLHALQLAHDNQDQDAAQGIAMMIHNGEYDPSPVPSIVPPGGTNKEGGSGSAYDPSAGGSELQVGPFHTGIHTSQGVDRFLSGAGQSMVDTGKGIAQVFGQRTPEQVDEDRRINAPLDATGAGLAGNVAGGAATFALPGMGAAKVLGAASKIPGLIGAGTKLASVIAPEVGGATIGAIEPVGTGQSRLRNAAIGAASAGAGNEVGKVAQSVVKSGVDTVAPAARTAFELARKYGIDLRVPQLSTSRFIKHYSNLTDALPFSGAEDRIAEQRAAFNNAIGKVSGIPNAHGAVTPDMLDDAKDLVGNSIGVVASTHTAVPTQNNIRGMMNVVQDARANATPENIKTVEDKVKQLFAHVDPNTGTIPGSAWRQANTALQRQIRSETDGDLKYYLGGLQDHFMDMMEQGIPHGTFDAWQGLRGQYRNLKSIEPLVEKGGNEGISPALLRQRLITAKNNRGQLSDLADIGKENIQERIPNSGTGQKNMIATLTGLGGASLIGHPGPAIAVAGNVLAHRALNSKLAARYMMSRMPTGLAKYVDPAVESLGPGAAAASGATGPEREDAEHDLGQAASSGALVGHADGGAVYKKASFWDLVQQAAKELGGSHDPSPAANQNSQGNPGDTASGTVGADFDRHVDQAVSAQDH